MGVDVCGGLSHDEFRPSELSSGSASGRRLYVRAGLGVLERHVLLGAGGTWPLRGRHLRLRFRSLRFASERCSMVMLVGIQRQTLRDGRRILAKAFEYLLMSVVFPGSSQVGQIL